MMYISKSFRLILVALTASVLVLATGCGGGGGSSGGGDGDDGFPTPRLPADAVTFDAANADDIAQTAVGFVDILDSVSELKTASSPSMPQVARLVVDRVMRKTRSSASVAARTENIGEGLCNPGTATAVFEESGNSESGSVTFGECDIEGSGLVIDGRFSYAASMNNNLDYSFQVGGSLTMAFSEESITSTIVMNLLESGNDGTGAFSSDVSYSLSGIPDNGILVTTAQPLVGNVSIGTEEGQLIVHGADDTLLRITVTSTNTAAVDLDEGNGIFVPFSTIPIAP